MDKYSDIIKLIFHLRKTFPSDFSISSSNGILSINSDAINKTFILS